MSSDGRHPQLGEGKKYYLQLLFDNLAAVSKSEEVTNDAVVAMVVSFRSSSTMADNSSGTTDLSRRS